MYHKDIKRGDYSHFTLLEDICEFQIIKGNQNQSTTLLISFEIYIDLNLRKILYFTTEVTIFNRFGLAAP